MTSPQPHLPGTWGRFSAALATVSISVALALLAVRTISAVSFSEPLLTITSGAEEESTFALWKYVQGLPVYADPHRPPFAASYYNWGFYEFYGSVIALVVREFNLESTWLPTIGRLISLVFAGIGTVIAYFAFRPGWALLGFSGRLLAACLAAFVFGGPLVGFWAISINPELVATVLGLAALVAFLSEYPRRPVVAVISGSILCYLAWSFKQSHVFAPGAFGLFLCFRRDWRSLGIFIVALAGAMTLTFWIGTNIYREMMVYFFPVLAKLVGVTPPALVFDTETLVRNLSNLAMKIGPLAAIGVVLPALAWPQRRLLHVLMEDDRLLLALSGIVVSAVLAIPATAKAGASENYYFPLTVYIALALSAAWPHLSIRPWAARAALAALAAGWAANAAACAIVLAGRSGVLSVRSLHDRLTAQRSCIASTLGPRFFSQTHLALPWINPSAPYFVYGYHYSSDRTAGHRFPEGSLHDLINAGYFGTLVVPEGSRAEFDGASFDGYVRASPACAGLSIYFRAALAAPVDERTGSSLSQDRSGQP